MEEQDSRMNIEEEEPILLQLNKDQVNQVKEIEIEEPAIELSVEQVNSVAKQLHLNDKIQLFAALFEDVNGFVDMSYFRKKEIKHELDPELAEELDRRHQNYLENPDDAITAEEFEKRMEDKYGF